MKVPLREYWDLLAKHIAPQRVRFALLVGLLLVSIGLQVINPQIMRRFLDGARGEAQTAPLAILAVAFIGIALFQQGVGVGATYVGENVAWTATNALRADLARHCLHLDMDFHSERTPGELIERIDGDVSQLSNFFSQVVVRVLGNILLLVGVLIALSVQDWRIGLPFIVFALFTLVVLYRIRGIAVPYDKARRQAEADLFGYLEERLAGTEDLRSSGAVDYAIRGLYKLHHAIQGHWTKARLMYLIVGTTGGMLHVLGMALSVVLGYYMFKRGIVSLGTAYLLVHYTNLLVWPIRDLTDQIENLQTIGASTERLSELYAIESRTRDGPLAFLPNQALSVSFAGVSFAYTEEEPVLHDVSLELAPREVLGLLGRTGSGKTTLARLLFRLYNKDAGDILLGGIEIGELQLKVLRERVAIVTQDVQLFQASVRDNLTFFDRTIADEQIEAVVDELELSDWYQSLPNGLDTELLSGGRGLSAGEAQLLAFTRVFLRDPGLVVLDEASSRLDPATERRIERAVDKLLHNRTAIIIAHRLGTVERADKIMILEQGQVVEYGRRTMLLADPTSRLSLLLRTGLQEVLA